MQTNGSDWLNQLAPDHAPPPLSPLSLWQLAPGWWAVAIICVLGAVALIVWHTRPAQYVRRSALRELKHIETTITDEVCLARDIEHVLRRYALFTFGHEAVAKLSGEAWIHFVIAHGGSAWANETGKALLRAAYSGKPSEQYQGGDESSKKTYRSLWLKGAKDFVKKNGKGKKR
ncbi:MAG: DUF4381 domain-containing protein [Pseudomonadota bacterium]